MTRTQHISLAMFIAAVTMLFAGFVYTIPASAHGNEMRKDTTASSTQKMRKMHEHGMGSTTASTTKRMGNKARNVDATCMQAAVDAREASLITTFGTFHDSVETALTARKSSLHDAWGLSEGKDRQKALIDAWKTWKSSHKDAFGELRDGRKSAWDAFKTAAKSCGDTLPKEEGLGADAAGSISL